MAWRIGHSGHLLLKCSTLLLPNEELLWLLRGWGDRLVVFYYLHSNPQCLPPLLTNTLDFKGNPSYDCTNDFTISNQSQHCREESFSTLLQREEAFMWSEKTRLIFFFFSSYETLLSKQPEWIVSVHFFKSHHVHLGMDVLGCWKSGPLVHRATMESPDQQFQNVPFSYIASMHTS